MLGQRYETVNQSWGRKDLILARKKSDNGKRGEFQKDIANLLGGGAAQAAFFSNARTGLHALLRSLHDKKNRTVMLCALNCPVVSDAVKNSGMKPHYFDLATKDGHIDCKAIAAQAPIDCGIVIITHLYGVPAASKRDFVHFVDKNITVIEDCAHSLGATIEGEVVGTLGDYSIFSFNYDKPISLGGGGMVWSNSVLPNSVVFESEQAILDTKEEWRELRWFRMFLAMKRFCGVMPPKIGGGLQKLYYYFTKSLGVADGGSGFPVSGLGGIRSQLGSDIIDCYEVIKEVRNQNAANLISQLELPIWGGSDTDVSPAWIRLRVLLPSQQVADGCIAKFRKEGLRVGRFNWPNLPSAIKESEFPNASLWAKRGVDLPVHSALSAADVDMLALKLNTINDAGWSSRTESNITV